jgi:V/A-type H+-transporting ATPase subunit D
MAQPSVAATRSNLLRTKRELGVAQQGHDVLDEKRQALILEVMAMVQDAEAARQEMNDAFAAAYRALLGARMSLGSERLDWIALSALQEPQVRISDRRVMGVLVPLVDTMSEASPLQYGLAGTTAALDEAVERFRDLLVIVSEMAEMMTAIWRLSQEIKKTQRRVKALENFTIPRLKSNLKFIQDTLDEKEREEHFRTKLIKKKLGFSRL